MTCAPSKDSDQPGHLPSLIRVFAVRFVGSSEVSDQTLRWAHRPLYWFCHAVVQIKALCRGVRPVGTNVKGKNIPSVVVYD